MEIVCPCWCPEADTIVKGLPILAEQGVTAIEIQLDKKPSYFDFRDMMSVERLVKCLDDNSIRVHSVHAPFGKTVDFSSLDDNIHECGVEAQIEALEFAKVVGAEVMVVHASDNGIGQDRLKRLDRARGVIRELARVAKQSNVIIAIENLPPGYLGCKAEEIAWLIEQANSDWVEACFDSGHANLTGEFSRTAQMLLPRAATTHLHDNDGTSDLHAFPGNGTIDWTEFGQLYKASGAVAKLVLECPSPKGVTWDRAFHDLKMLIGCSQGRV